MSVMYQLHVISNLHAKMPRLNTRSSVIMHKLRTIVGFRYSIYVCSHVSGQAGPWPGNSQC